MVTCSILQIRVMRKRKGLTQKQFAEKLNYTRSAISQWERSLRTPTVETLLDIATVLECSVNDLYKPEVRTW